MGFLLDGLVELDHLFALFEEDVSLLPVRTVALVTALAAKLAGHVGHANLFDLDAEQLLHRLLDVGLGGVAMHLEDEGADRLLLEGGLLRHERTTDDFKDGVHRASLSSSRESAAV